jgi:CheY-like chemotaxis protein
MPERAVILLAEDEEDYVLLIRHAFSQAKIPNPLYVVWNGQEAIAYLMGTGIYANRAEYPCQTYFCLTSKCRVLTDLRFSNGLESSRV